MLEAADVSFRVEPSTIDESDIKAMIREPSGAAVELARAKALSVSGKYSGDWIVGSDSIVSVDGRLFDKPGSRREAAEHLRLFSGRTMMLTSAVALACNSRIEWDHSETALLHVRSLSDAWIEQYLDKEWPEVGYCVGVFRLEGRGVQLFERIEGDHFAILGMPLIPLLRALRTRGVIAA